jgi:septum formation protein
MTAAVGPLDLQLASTSPRRRELLVAAGLRFVLCPPGPEYDGGGDEHASEAGDPRQHAIARATRKGEGAIAVDPAAPILAVDTVVAVDGVELGKPRDVAEAAAMLRRLAGRAHRVHTAHFLRDVAGGHRGLRVATSEVVCGLPSPDELGRYLASGQWRGKAGGYGVQDDAQSFFRVLSGRYDTVVGLSVESVQQLLDELRSRR